MILFPALARTQPGSPYNKDFVLPRGFRGIAFRLNITAAGGTTPTLDVKFQGYDDAAGAYFDLTETSAAAPVIAFATKSGAGSDTLAIYPPALAFAQPATNKRWGAAIPRKLRVVATFGVDVDETFTFSLAGIPLE